jgi:hypothetical protein
VGLFSWLLDRKLVDFAPGRGWTIEVVGEAQFQENLEREYRAHAGTGHDVKAAAALIPDEENLYDRNAVRVKVGRRQVGFLSRKMAAEYRAAVGDSSGQCKAKIVGGFALNDGTTAHFGVKPNLAWPPRF